MTKKSAPILVSLNRVNEKGYLREEEENRKEYENDAREFSLPYGIKFACNKDENADCRQEQDE